MLILTKVRNRLSNQPENKPFSLKYLFPAGGQSSVKKSVAYLISTGELVRVYRGIYVRPRLSPLTGTLAVNPTDVAEAVVARYGHAIQIYGAEAVRVLGLSTQMQMISTFYTSGPSRKISYGKAVVSLINAPEVVFLFPRGKMAECIVAMYYVGEKRIDKKIVDAVVRHLSIIELSELLIADIPFWMKHAIGKFTATSIYY